MKTLAITFIAALLVFHVSLAASDELTRAKDLYRSAAYDEALGLLDGITSPGKADAIEVHEYRVLCLVALDRKDDAKRAIEALITSAPDYRMSEQDASPRVRAMFTEVRRALLPSIVQRTYADAKAAFDRKDQTAAASFDRVLTLLKDPDVAGNPALADLATVATGFRDLSSVLASTPPPTPPAMAAVAGRGGRSATAAAGPTTITPPVAISQVIPPPTQIREQREWNGEVELVIDESGKVVSARMSKSLHPFYDAQLLRAAKSWTYKPALKNGVPMQMMKVVSVHIDSRPACTPKLTSNCRLAETD